jgi:hypothetical protein
MDQLKAKAFCVKANTPVLSFEFGTGDAHCRDQPFQHRKPVAPVLNSTFAAVGAIVLAAASVFFFARLAGTDVVALVLVVRGHDKKGRACCLG